jgi:Na+/H+ antiporter NhaC
MSLDDREQQILSEIERQFYEEDPSLARAVRNINKPRRFGIRLPVVGLVLGMVIVLAFFTVQTFVALGGFVVIVASASALVYELSDRNRATESSHDPGSGKTPWLGPFGRG